MKTLSLTARVSLLFAVGVTAVLLGLGWLVAGSVDRHFREMDRDELEGKLALVANLLAKAGSPAAMDGVPGELDDALVGHAGLSVTLIDADGSKWFASRGLDYPAALFQAPEQDGLRTWRQAGRGYRGLMAPVTTGYGRTLTAAIVLDISHHLHYIDAFKRTLAVVMAPSWQPACPPATWTSACPRPACRPRCAPWRRPSTPCWTGCRNPSDACRNSPPTLPTNCARRCPTC